MEKWLPLAEYAVAKGISISTVRRRIKSDLVNYRMENGRYLVEIGFEENSPKTIPNINTKPLKQEIKPVSKPPMQAFFQPQSQIQSPPQSRPIESKPSVQSNMANLDVSSAVENLMIDKIGQAIQEFSQADELRWKALEARVSGLAKKVEYLAEQTSELKMLVKIFEEKLNASLS